MAEPWKDNNGVAWPKCPECGSEDVYFENPATGCGTYACCDCGHELTSEEVKVFEEWERRNVVEDEIIAYRSLLGMVLLWRNMDGDGITDPLRSDIKQTLDYFKRKGQPEDSADKKCKEWSDHAFRFGSRICVICGHIESR